MKCPKCGMENKKDAKFCAGCGTSLETIEEQKEASNSEKPKKKGKKHIFVGITGVLLIAAVIVAGIWVTKENQVKKQYQDHLASGQKYLEELNYKSAEDSYLKAIAIDPKKPEPYLKLIDTYIAQERYDDATKIAKQAQKKVPEKDVEEFQKLEQEYESVINYEWVVDPTIEADDIYYVRMGSGERKSENERRKQYESGYAVIQQGKKLGLIDMNGTMRTGMDYTWIESGYLMERLDKTGLSYYDAFYDNELHLDIITDFFDEKGQYIYYQNALHNLAEWEGWAYTFQEPEQTIPVRNAEGTVEVSDPYAWWNEQQGKYGLYKNRTMITDFIYDECGSVSEGLIAVKKDDKWGYVDENGNEIIPIEYDASWQQFEDETVVATQERKITDFCYGASEGYIPLVQEGKWKLADLEGKTAIPTGIFEKICPVYNGKCWVKKDGKWGVIQISDKKEETEKTEEKKSAQMSIATGEYKFASGELLSEFHIAEENGKKNCDLMFWHNSGAAMADEDFYFEWNDQQSTYEVQGKSSRNMFHITFTYIDDKSIKIEVVCNEEFFDWKTGEKSKSWSSEVYTKVEEMAGIQDWSVTEIGNAVAKHYNTVNHSEDYVVFNEESTQTESGYEVIVRYQDGTVAKHGIYKMKYKEEEEHMAFLDDINDKLAKLSQGAIQKTKDMSDSVKISNAIREEENQQKIIYQKIGELYYHCFKDVAEGDFLVWCQQIAESKNKVVVWKDQLQNLKGVVLCPNCNAGVPINSVFCNNCGEKLPQKSMQPDNQGIQSGKICKNCGQIIPEGHLFCTNCGAKVETEDEKREERTPEGYEVETEKNVKICKNCGSAIPEGNLFCTNCGVKQQEPVVDSEIIELPLEKEKKKVCPNCGTEMEIDQMFCTQCGTAYEKQEQEQHKTPVQEKVCPNCGKEIKEGQRFCTGCGVKL